MAKVNVCHDCSQEIDENDPNRNWTTQNGDTYHTDCYERMIARAQKHNIEEQEPPDAEGDW